MAVLLHVIGGVALILFGVRFLRKGLDRLFGNQLSVWMQQLSGSRWRAFFAGLFVTILMPSSTTMSVLAVQTVQAGQIPARRMLAIILGSNIGLTALIQVIALPVDNVAPVLLALGVLLFQFTNGKHSRGTGQIVLAMGFIFMGVLTIKGAFPASAISEHSDLIQLVEIAQRYPLFLAIIAMVLAMSLQSSTAAIAIIIGLGMSQGIDLSLNAAVAWMVGANVGIGLTMIFLGWSQIESRRMAVGNLIAKLVTAAIVLALLPWVTALLEQTPGAFGFKIANAHTAFNILLAAMAMPLVETLSRLTEKLIPDPPQSSAPAFGPRYLSDAPSDSVTLALNASMREVLHISEIAQSMLRDLWQAMQDQDEHAVQQISQRDDKIDLLDDRIKRFLTKLGNIESDPESAAEQMRQLRYLSDMETVGDIIDKNLCELATKKIRLNVRFSEEGWKELNSFCDKVIENMMIADTVFLRSDETMARKLLRHKEHLNNLERTLRDRHFARLNQGTVQSHESSAIHLDLLTNLKRINSHLTHVAYGVIEIPPPVRE